jgi:SulP family sulfate permease
VVPSPLLRRLLPFLTWSRGINRRNLRVDALAGVTVALVAIPQSLAYAQLAGLPAFYGLYAALVPTVVGALFGSSAQLSTGPVALTSLLTAASIASLAVAGSSEYIGYAVTVALLSGLFQLAFGVMRLGVLMNLLSHPVLMGFVNAAAILITLSQLPALVGAAPPATGHIISDAWFVVADAAHIHVLSLVFGLVALAQLIAFRRYAPRWPGVLITAATLTAASYLSGFAQSGGRIVGEIPAGLPGFSLPAFELDTWIRLLPASFAVAVISFMEAMSSAKIAAIKTATKWDENQELIGQGLAKIAAAVCHTMPVSGSFSRSALNLAANAQTGISSIVTALCVLVTVLFFTPLLKYLPQPVLAAIIMMALVNLINLGSLRTAWKASRDDALAAALTFMTTIAFAPQIQNGIFTGILVSLALFIYRRMRPKMSVLAPAVVRANATTIAGGPDAESLGDAVGIVRFDASLVFVNVSYFEKAVLRLEHDSKGLQFVLVSCGAINGLDASGVEMLSALVEELRKKGIVVVFCAVKPHVRDVLDRTGLSERIGVDNFFNDEPAALAVLATRLSGAGHPETPLRNARV